MAENDLENIPVAPEAEGIQPVDENGAIDQDQSTDSILDQISDADLSVYLIRKLQDDIRNREDGGWATQQRYSEAAYGGYRRPVNEPWKDASNYAGDLTRSLLNSAHANTISSIHDNKSKVVDAKGVGKEDVKNEAHVESIINYEILCEIDDSFNIIDHTVLRAFKNGNACIKCYPGWNDKMGKIIWKTVPIQNLFLPISAKSAQPDDADHIFELIPLTESEYEDRKIVKAPDGELAYKDFDNIQKGAGVSVGDAYESILQTRDAITKTSLGDFYTDSARYIMEGYLTYWHKPTDGSEAVKVELIVTFSPQGGRIHRKKLNEDLNEQTGQAIRPYSIKWIPYPNEDRIYGVPLPWMIKKEQEEYDYYINQMSNALEKAIKTQVFYDPNGAFDPEETQQSPNGWFPVPNPRQNIFIPTYDMSPIFNLFKFLDLFRKNAETMTGLTELFQGMEPDRGSTLGEVERRMNKSEIRFDTVYKRLEQGYSELINLTWHYIKKYMPKDKAIRILGTGEFKKIEEVFPKGVAGNYNFKLTSAPLTERFKEKQNAQECYDYATSTDLFKNSEANQWRLLDMVWKSKGKDNLGHFVSEPKGIVIIPAKEAIRRVMGGEYTFIPHPTVDAESYLTEIKIFMRSDTFGAATPEEKQGIQRMFQISQFYRQGQMRAAMDAQIIQQNMQAEALVNNTPIVPGQTPVPGQPAGQPPLPPEGGDPNAQL